MMTVVTESLHLDLQLQTHSIYRSLLSYISPTSPTSSCNPSHESLGCQMAASVVRPRHHPLSPIATRTRVDIHQPVKPLMIQFQEFPCLPLLRQPAFVPIVAVTKMPAVRGKTFPYKSLMFVLLCLLASLRIPTKIGQKP